MRRGTQTPPHQRSRTIVKLFVSMLSGALATTGVAIADPGKDERATAKNYALSRVAKPPLATRFLPNRPDCETLCRAGSAAFIRLTRFCSGVPGKLRHRSYELTS